MVIDTSALIAILLGEPDAELYRTAMIRAASVRLSSVTCIETSTVARGRGGPKMEAEVDLLISLVRGVVLPQSLDEVALARGAYARFGKGFHPARLNIMDCCAYALAMHLREPLLFKGGDFALTDVVPAV